MTHGMAGLAGLIVLSLGAVQSWQTGVALIALFGAGSIVGMATLSIAIAIPLRITATVPAISSTGSRPQSAVSVARWACS